MYEIRRDFRIISGISSVPTPAATAYAGPGDAVSGAYAWYGFQAYTASSIGSNVVRLRESGGNTEQDFATIAGGGLDLAAIAIFKGANNLFVRSLYDQTGNGRTLTNATAGNQPAFLLNQINGLPTMSFTAASSQRLTQTAGTTSFSDPWTLASVIRFAASDGNLAFNPGTTANDILLRRGFSPNVVQFYINGTSYTAAATDAAFHSITWVANGVSSDICVDGSSNSGTVGSSSTVNELSIGGSGAFGFFDGLCAEFGFYTSALSAANETAMFNNQHTRYGV